MRRLEIVLTLTAALFAMNCAAAPSPAPAAGLSAPAHLVEILLENHEFGEIVGNSAAPYINGTLIPNGRLFTNYDAVSHPSLPNYLALTSGGLCGKAGTDDVTPRCDAKSIFDQLRTNGRGWKAFAESMPAPCDLSDSSNYAVRHNPPPLYSSMAGSSYCAAHNRPLPSSISSLPKWTFVTPNLCDDMHDCSVATGDQWLSTWVPRFLAIAGTEVVVTFDEGNTSIGGGGRVMTVEIGSGVPAGVTDGAAYTHYSLLRAVEHLYGFRKLGAAATATELPLAGQTATPVSISSSPPPGVGYFTTNTPPGNPTGLPDNGVCAGRVHLSTWEPRPDNAYPNSQMPDPTAVHDAFAARPRDQGGTYDPRWDSWLLPRVDGQYAGTTDEIFQWAACKWGLRDNLLRAIAVRESTWYQYEVYPSGRCVWDFGCGDAFSGPSAASRTYCDGIAAFGYDYQADFGPGLCPKTFSITGIMSWDDPAWQAPYPPYAGNQNGTFPFSRNSTAFAEDYVGSYLRGCFEGWVRWLADTGTGTYAAGDLWGCVGSWYSGDWHSTAANAYISKVKRSMKNRPWLASSWPSNRPGCSGSYGCPEGWSGY